MGEQQPKAEDGLGENVEHPVGNNLRVNINLPCAVGDTPHAFTRLASTLTMEREDIHWV